ncbi:A24 family peptidase [Lederbergia panacisoli]|uniref:A24 family peptidase n=1 Tax=Lederbergia panacisoli TaxID=1255251 RepID=UPI00214A9094|nr:prepilin peptidase [Lederbergia panacisoli]MCR2823182.1 prepilin peptidase [Lederbergia panacisoli]
MQIIDWLLLIILAICFITDVRERKIYNKILLPALLLAIIWNIVTEGLSGFGSSMLGMTAGFLLLLIPYLMKGMGAGDVKLLAVIGAMKGASFVLLTGVYMAIIGAGIAVILIAWRLLRSRQLLTLFYRNSLMNFRMKLELIRSYSSNKAFPYGVAIAFGAVVTLLTNGVISL